MYFRHFISVLKLSLLLLVHAYSYGQTRYQKDFEYYWNTINNNFSYFDSQKTNWKKVKDIYQPIADTISSSSSFLRFLETVNHEFYNGHISLNANLSSSSKLIPTGSDLWVIFKDKHFIISATRKGFNAELSGLKKGMIITQYNGIPIYDAVQHVLPKSVLNYDNRMFEYAANLVLAGTHDNKRKITVLTNDGEKTYFPDSNINRLEFDKQSIIEHKIISPGIGYIKVNNSLGNMELIKAFDSTLNLVWNTRGLILDLRETPSGGNTTVARAIMSRFIDKDMPYQKHSLPGEERQFGVKRSWVEWVSPRQRIYKKKLVVLVNRWTGSMGEGLAIGFDGMKRAQIVGDKMAGLLGAIYSFNLPETKIGFSIPVEKLFHVNGLPREQFVPAILETDNEKILEKAIKLFNVKD